MAEQNRLVIKKIVVGRPLNTAVSTGTIANLTDTSLNSLTSGQALFYNTANSRWENGTFTAGEGIDLTWDSSADTLTIAAEYADSANPGIASFSINDFSVDSVGAVTINFASLPESLIPAADSAYDLGSSAKKWKDLYLSGNTIYLGSSQYISVDSANNQLQFNGNNVVVSGDSASEQAIRNLFSASGSLSYNGSTGAFSYTDSDRTASQIKELLNADGKIIDYNSATGVFTVDSADIKNIFSGDSDITYNSSTGGFRITETGVTAGTYGSSTLIPVFTVNSTGQLDSVGTVQVAGVDSASWDSATNTYRISLATGSNLDTIIGGFNNISFKGLSDSATSVIRSKFSATGSLLYNQSTGVFTYTDSDRTAGQIKGLLTGGNGITYDNSSGQISLTGDSQTFAGLTVANNLSVSGDLIVSGTTTTVNTETINLADNIITLNSNFTSGSPSENAGIEVLRGDAATKSIQWNETADQWYVESDGTGTIKAGLVEADSANVNGQPVLTDGDTSFIRELFSDGGGGGLSYNSSTGVFTDSSRSEAEIKGMFSASGDNQILSYNVSTGQFSTNLVDSDIAKTNTQTLFHNGIQIPDTKNIGFLDSDGIAQGSIFHYETGGVDQFVISHNNRIQIKSAQEEVRIFAYDSVRIRATQTGASINGVLTADDVILQNRTDVSGVYGSASLVPVFTLDSNGLVDSAGTVSVAGVSSTSWDSSTNVYTISTADGGSFATPINGFNTISFKGLSDSATGVVRSKVSSTSGIINYDNTTGIFSDDSAVFTRNVRKQLKVGGTSLSYDSSTGELSYSDSDRSASQIKGLFSASGSLSYNNSTGAFSYTDSDRTSSNIKGLFSAAGDLSYNSSTGEFSYTDSDRSASQIKELFSASGSLSYNSTTGQFSYTDSDRDSAVIKGMFSAGGDLTYNSATGQFSYTDSDRSASAIKGLFSGAGDITYNSSTGEFSYTDSDRSASQIKGLFSASGGGLSYNSTTGAFTDSDRSASQIKELFSATGSLSYNSSTGAFSYTDSDRSEAQIKGMFSAGGDLSYNSSTGQFSYTDSDRSASAIKGLFSGAGDITYNSSTGEFSYTDSARSASQIKGLFSAGTGVTYNSTSGAISVGQAVGTGDSPTFAGLTITGDLVIGGTTTTVNTTDLVVDDPLIQLAHANESNDIVDIGFVGHYYRNAQRRHTGLFRDADNQQYYLFYNLIDSAMDSTAPPQVVNRGGTDYAGATLNIGTLIANDSALVNGSPVVKRSDTSFIRGLFSDGGGGGLSYNSSTGVFTDSARSAAQIKGLFSDGGGGGLSYNSTTGVFTDSSRSATDIKGLFSGSGDITYNSGTGAFSYTDSARTEAQIKGMFSASGGGLSYNSTTGAFTDSDRSRAEILGLLSAGGSLSYNSSTGEFTYTDSDRTASQIKGLFSAAGNLSYNSSTGVFSYTDSDRDDAVIKGMFSASGDLSYNSATGVFSYTDSDRSASAIKGLFSGAGDITYNSSTGEFSYTDSDRSASQIKGLFSASGGGLSYNSTTGAFTDSDRSASDIKGLFSAGGDLSYNSSTGEFTYTDSDRSASAIKGLFSAGGDLSYNSSTGEFTYTDSDRSAAQIKQLFSASGDLSYDNSTGIFSISGVDSAQIRNIFSASGDLTYDSATGQFSYTDSDRSASAIKGLFSAAGDLSYNSSTGEFSYTDSDRSALSIKGLFSAGTGVTYNSTTGAISIGQDVATSATPTFTGLTITDKFFTSDSGATIVGNGEITGNLLVRGTTTTINSETLTVNDNIIVLNNNVTGTPTENAGIEVERGTSANKSILWNETADKWYIESDGNGSLVTGLLEADSATVGGAPVLTDADTSFIRGLVSATGSLSYDNSTGVISYTDSDRSRSQILGLIQAGSGLNWSADSGLMTLTGYAYDRYEYFVTGLGTTTFLDSDIDGKVLSYNTLATFVTLNGIILDPSDYTASNGTSVVLGQAADSGDTLAVYAFNVNGVSDTVSASNGGTFQNNVTVQGNLTATSLIGGGTGITSLTGQVVIDALLTVDSNGSGLNADTLDGQQGTYYRINVYDASGTLLN